MKTAEEIADEIEALNKRYLREYWRDRDSGIDRTTRMFAATDDPEVLDILGQRSGDSFAKLGARMYRRKELLVINAILGVKDDKSFGMTEIVER